MSESTEAKRGVRQGCRPYLFNIYTEFIFRETQKLKDLTISGININNLYCADGRVLLADDKVNLQKIGNRITQESDKKGLNMNI